MSALNSDNIKQIINSQKAICEIVEKYLHQVSPDKLNGPLFDIYKFQLMQFLLYISLDSDEKICNECQDLINDIFDTNYSLEELENFVSLDNNFALTIPIILESLIMITNLGSEEDEMCYRITDVYQLAGEAYLFLSINNKELQGTVGYEQLIKLIKYIKFLNNSIYKKITLQNKSSLKKFKFKVLKDLGNGNLENLVCSVNQNDDYLNVNNYLEKTNPLIDTSIKKMLKDLPYYFCEYYDYLQKNDISDATKKNYIQLIKKFSLFLEKKYDFNLNDFNVFNKLSRGILDDFIDFINKGDSYVATCLYAIKSFFDFLENEKCCLDNNLFHTYKIKTVKKNYDAKYLTNKEIDIIRRNILDEKKVNLDLKKNDWIKRDYLIFMMLLNLGLKVSEIINLNTEDVDFDFSQITIREKKEVRFIPIGEKMKKIIKDWLECREEYIKGNSSALFVSHRGIRISVAGIGKILEKYSTDIEMQLTPELLRSTFGVNLYNSTHDLIAVAKVMGIVNINNVLKFAENYEPDMEEIGEVMDSLFE